MLLLMGFFLIDNDMDELFMLIILVTYIDWQNRLAIHIRIGITIGIPMVLVFQKGALFFKVYGPVWAATVKFFKLQKWV